MIQYVSFVPGFSGGDLLPSFSDLTASKPLFSIKACFYRSRLFPVLFFQIVHNISHRTCSGQRKTVSRFVADKGISLPLSAFMFI